jgi:hypothetical protein
MDPVLVKKKLSPRIEGSRSCKNSGFVATIINYPWSSV